MFPFTLQKYHNLKRRYKTIDGVTVIEMNLKNADSLFDLRDPAPFREKDLDEDAVKYITTALREIDVKENVRLKIFMSHPRGPQDNEGAIKDAMSTYFSYEAEMKRSERDHIFRMAFKSLMIGLTVLCSCLYFSQLLAGRESFIAKFLTEGFHILGWYSMWKPVYFGLYEWWPIREEELLLLKASDMSVEISYFQEPKVLNDKVLSDKISSEETTSLELKHYHPVYK